MAPTCAGYAAPLDRPPEISVSAACRGKSSGYFRIIHWHYDAHERKPLIIRCGFDVLNDRKNG